MTSWKCPETATGEKLILLANSAGAAYCIDQRETTRGEYKKFLNAKGKDVSGQPTECGWNQSYSPIIPKPGDAEQPGMCPPEFWSLDDKPEYPVVCVDFCDAFAYCTWAGKRLCGQVGFGKNTVNTMDYEAAVKVLTSTESEWFNACSNGELRVFSRVSADTA